jgi:hypothetical protein
MVRTLACILSAAAVCAVLLGAAPALACDAHKKADATAAKPEATPANVLAPVDEVLSATCNCSGPSDCTCKKGECKCKKCSKQHGVKPGTGSTRLIEPLKNQQQSPELPQNARHDATGGVLI